MGLTVTERTVHVPDEQAALAADAIEMRRLTAAERVRLFCSIMDAIAGIWSSLSRDEQLRRLRIGETLDPRPQPWWLCVKAQARP